MKPNHSIYVQSWQPKELTYAKLNADGFGFGWHTQEGTALSYRSSLPIWNDVNLPDLSTALCSSSWVAMVRSATLNHPHSPLNAQPFKYQQYLFCHNGFIQNFNDGIMQQVLLELPPEIAKNIHGLTDSEYLFALFCQLLTDDSVPSMQKALIGTIHWCEKKLSGRKAILNMMVTNGRCLIAVKHSINEIPASLYYADGNYPELPKNSRLIASERFSEHDCWQTVQTSSLITMTLDQAIMVEHL